MSSLRQSSCWPCEIGHFVKVCPCAIDATVHAKETLSAVPIIEIRKRLSEHCYYRIQRNGV